MMDVECVNNMVISTCDKRVYSSVYTNSRFFFDRFSAEWGEVLCWDLHIQYNEMNLTEVQVREGLLIMFN